MALRSCGTHKHIIPGVSQKTVSGLCILWGITSPPSQLWPRAQSSSARYSEQTVQVTSGGGEQQQANVSRPDLNFPNIQQQFVESLFFLVLFSFDLDLCVTAGSRLTRLIVNLSPNSNPDIYHGLISVQIRVQQNWNIIEVTPNPSSIFHRNVFIWIVAVMLLCTLCRNVIMCVPSPL